MSPKNNRNCQKAVKRTMAHCLRGQKVGGAVGVILQRTIAIVLKGQNGFRCNIAMTSRVTRLSGGVRRVSGSAEGSSGGVKRDDITYATAACCLEENRYHIISAAAVILEENSYHIITQQQAESGKCDL